MDKTGKVGRAIQLAAMTVMMLLTASCAYRFSGGEAPPFGIRRIAVLMFENRTSEIGVEGIFVNDLIDELTKDGRMLIAPAEHAEGVFKGVVKNMNIDTISRRESYVPLERRATLILDVAFEDNQGNVLWSQRDMARSESYGVSPDKRQTEMNRRDAIRELSVTMARDIYQRLAWENHTHSVPR